MTIETFTAAAAVFVAVTSLMTAIGAGQVGLSWPSRLQRLGAVGPPGGAGLPALIGRSRMKRPRTMERPWALPSGALRRLRHSLGWSARTGPDEDDLEEGLYALASALEAGSGIIQALGLAAEQSPPRLAHEFLRITDEFAAGVPLPECLSHARDRVPQSSFSSLCDTIDIQRLSGGDLRAGLASLTDIIRERRDLRQELKVKTTEARQSAIVLALIPPVIGVAAWLMNPELMSPLWVYPAGRLGLAAGIGLWLLGGWTAARLTRVRDLEE